MLKTNHYGGLRHFNIILIPYYWCRSYSPTIPIAGKLKGAGVRVTLTIASFEAEVMSLLGVFRPVPALVEIAKKNESDYCITVTSLMDLCQIHKSIMVKGTGQKGTKTNRPVPDDYALQQIVRRAQQRMMDGNMPPCPPPFTEPGYLQIQAATAVGRSIGSAVPGAAPATTRRCRCRPTKESTASADAATRSGFAIPCRAAIPIHIHPDSEQAVSPAEGSPPRL